MIPNTLSSSRHDADQTRWAVLIDAENTSSKYIAAILTEIASLGVIVVKRVYGDFSHPTLHPWKAKAQEHGLAPVHCFRSVSGKSNSDMALAIDAMDWLHSGQIDGICLITSDSDFAPLALRIKEGGRLAYGFGRQITPKSFVNAVHRFVYAETLLDEDESMAVSALSAVGNDASMSPSTSDTTTAAPVSVAVPSSPEDAAARTNTKPAVMPLDQAVTAMIAAINDLSQINGWANLAAVGNLMIKRFPDFSPLNYRMKKLITFVERLPGVEFRRDNDTTVVVRIRSGDSA